MFHIHFPLDLAALLCYNGCCEWELALRVLHLPSRLARPLPGSKARRFPFTPFELEDSL